MTDHKETAGDRALAAVKAQPVLSGMRWTARGRTAEAMFNVTRLRLTMVSSKSREAYATFGFMPSQVRDVDDCAKWLAEQFVAAATEFRKADSEMVRSRDALEAANDRAARAEAALREAAQSLTALSTAGARNGDPMLADMIDVRGFAASRAKVAWAAVAEETIP